MSVSDRCGFGPSHTGIAECRMGHEPGSAMSSRELLPIRVSTGPIVDAMGSFGHILHISAIHGRFPYNPSAR